MESVPAALLDRSDSGASTPVAGSAEPMRSSASTVEASESDREEMAQSRPIARSSMGHLLGNDLESITTGDDDPMAVVGLTTTIAGWVSEVAGTTSPGHSV